MRPFWWLLTLSALGLACEHPKRSQSDGEPSGLPDVAVVSRSCPSTPCDRCDIDVLARRLAGQGAFDCGWSRSDAERATLVRCALEKAGGAGRFLALESLRGIDSVIVQAFVRGADGRLVRLWYDSDASGANCPCSALVRLQPCTSGLRTRPDQPEELTCAVEEKAMGELLCSEKKGAR